MQSSTVLSSFLLLFTAPAVFAQESAILPPPKVLVIEREYTKPGREGAHARSESAFAKAWSDSKVTTYYVAAESLSGPSRALFLLGFDSLAQWGEETVTLEKSGVMEKYDHLMQSDGDLLTGGNQSVFTLDTESSLAPRDLVHERYMEFTQFAVKPGRMHEFMEVSKVYRDALQKVNPEANFSVYREYFGTNANMVLIISTDKSLAEDDRGMGNGKKLYELLGAEKYKQISDMEADSVESVETNLFAISPTMSYSNPSWVKADIFWKQKSSPAHGAGAKPAGVAKTAAQ